MCIRDSYNSSQENSEDFNQDNQETADKAESIRAQKDFGLMAQKLQHKYSQMNLQVQAKRRQLGVLCDRFGRFLIDVAPHFMLDSEDNNQQTGRSLDMINIKNRRIRLIRSVIVLIEIKLMVWIMILFLI